MAIVQPHREALSGSLRFTAQISSLRFIMCLMKYSCFLTLYQTNRTVGAQISQQTNLELQPKNPGSVLIFKVVTQLPFHFLETLQIDKTLLMTTKHKYLNGFVMNYSTVLCTRLSKYNIFRWPISKTDTIYSSFCVSIRILQYTYLSMA